MHIRHLLPLLLLLLFPACFGDENYEMEEYVKIGHRLPSFSVDLSDGTRYDAATPQPSIIVFFNTSCIDCQKELPILDAQYKSGAFADRRIVCISRAETDETIRAFWSANGLSLPYSAQPDRSIFSLFASAGIPRIYVTDAQGVVTSISYSAEHLILHQ